MTRMRPMPPRLCRVGRSVKLAVKTPSQVTRRRFCVHPRCWHVQCPTGWLVGHAGYCCGTPSAALERPTPPCRCCCSPGQELPQLLLLLLVVQLLGEELLLAPHHQSCV